MIQNKCNPEKFGVHLSLNIAESKLSLHLQLQLFYVISLSALFFFGLDFFAQSSLQNISSSGRFDEELGMRGEFSSF